MYGGENAGLKGGSAIITAWLTVPIRRAERRLRLFCFPHAGGGASSFVPLAGLLPSSIELAAVLLPGRETRFREPAFARMEPLVRALADGLRDELGAPFAFMGHSMGALVAFELARELRRRSWPLPTALIVSGRRAPNLGLAEAGLHRKPDGEFVNAIHTRYGGIPAVILDEPELLALFLPTLKADFAVFETYDYRPEPPLPCALAFFGGMTDPQSAPEASDGWFDLVSGPTSRRLFAGGHFYLTEQRQALAQAIAENLLVRAPVG